MPTISTRLRVQSLIFLMALVLGACEPPLPTSDPSPGPATDNAEMRPDLMTVTPSEPSPGDVVEVHWPPETLRGQCWVLERWEGETWQHRFHLASTDVGMPAWAPREDGPMCTDIGVGDLEPDRLVIPEVATPGLYRLCDVGQDVTRCVEVTVRD